MDEVFVCWKCTQELEKDMMPIVPLSQCKSCSTDLHVCVTCEHYDSKYSGKCNSDEAEIMHELEQANFCNYFSLKPSPFLPGQDRASKEAKSRLEALFGWEKKRDRREV